MPTEEGWLSTATKVVSILALLVSGAALAVSLSAYRLQERVADRVWRSQLLTTVYESDSCPTAPACPPKANLRSREEAIRAYVKLQRDYNVRVDLRSVFLSQMVFRGEDFSKSNLSGATLHITNFAGANLSGSWFVNADLTRAAMTNTDLHGANFTSASLEGADLSGANLEKAQMSKARLGVCGEQQFDSATGEPYRSADLRGAILRGAILDGAFLCGVNLRGADLTDVQNASQDQINQTEGDRDTKLPPYLTRPASWDGGK